MGLYGREMEEAEEVEDGGWGCGTGEAGGSGWSGIVLFVDERKGMVSSWAGGVMMERGVALYRNLSPVCPKRAIWTGVKGGRGCRAQHGQYPFPLEACWRERVGMYRVFRSLTDG